MKYPKIGSAASLLATTALLLSACGGGESAPVASLAVEPLSVDLPFPQSARLHFRWTPQVARGEMGENPIVFVHLIDSEGEMVRTFDHPLHMGDWAVGSESDYEVEIYQSDLAPGLDPGVYQLTAGLYDLGGERYGLLTEQGAEAPRLPSASQTSLLESRLDFRVPSRHPRTRSFAGPQS